MATRKTAPSSSTSVPVSAPKPASKAVSSSSVKTQVSKKPVKKVEVKRASKTASSKAKPALSAKVKLVRDSFTLPEADHALIKKCKKAAVMAGRETKKSEVVRAAIQVFSAMPINAQLSAYAKLSAIALGRPKAE
jgi:ATP-dependent Zn protease